MNRSDLRRDWETLARKDPLWAVYVRQDTKEGRWDIDEFLATGEAEIARSWSMLERLGLPAPRGTALDFGSGVGRLTRALSAKVETVVGVDISETMVIQARTLCADSHNTSFLISDSPDIPLKTASIDLVYSSLVLQHLPQTMAEGYLREFLRVLRPSGLAVVQVATRPRLSFKGLAFKFLPASAYSGLQTRVLGYPAPMRMQATSITSVRSLVTSAGGSVLAEESDVTYGGHWHYVRLVISAGMDS